jgi:hypothetical protein
MPECYVTLRHSIDLSASNELIPYISLMVSNKRALRFYFVPTICVSLRLARYEKLFYLASVMTC